MENQKKESPYNLHYYADGIEVTQRIFNAIAICNILRPDLSVHCIIAQEKRPPFSGVPAIEKMIRDNFANYFEEHPEEKLTYCSALKD